MKEPSPNVVKSAARVLEIFEMFDELRRPVTINEVAAHLGYPHSSSAALLKSLDSLGYLEYEPDERTFFPSVRISMLGNWVENESLPVRAVQRLMQDLLQSTGCTVITAIRAGVYCQYIKVMQGTAAIRYHVNSGTRRLLHESTLGRILIAQMDHDQGRDLFMQSIRRSDLMLPADAVDELYGEISRIRQQGFACNTGLIVPNATLLGVPLTFDRRGRPVAIGIAAPSDQIVPRRDEFVKQLRNHTADFDRSQVEQENLA